MLIFITEKAGPAIRKLEACYANDFTANPMLIFFYGQEEGDVGHRFQCLILVLGVRKSWC